MITFHVLWTKTEFLSVFAEKLLKVQQRARNPSRSRNRWWLERTIFLKPPRTLSARSNLLKWLSSCPTPSFLKSKKKESCALGMTMRILKTGPLTLPKKRIVFGRPSRTHTKRVYLAPMITHTTRLTWIGVCPNLNKCMWAPLCVPLWFSPSLLRKIGELLWWSEIFPTNILSMSWLMKSTLSTKTHTISYTCHVILR